MVTVRPDVPLDARYNQKDAAAILGVERHTIMNYERSGCIRFQVRKAGGRKFTTGKEIIRCWTATYL